MLACTLHSAMSWRHCSAQLAQYGDIRLGLSRACDTRAMQRLGVEGLTRSGTAALLALPVATAHEGGQPKADVHISAADGTEM